MSSSKTATSRGKNASSAESATSRLEACLQQIVDSDDSASSLSVQSAVDILTLKEVAAALSELPKFKDDDELWARGYSILGGAKQREMFMACPDIMKRYYWLTHEMTRVERAELGTSNWFAPASSNPGGF